MNPSTLTTDAPETAQPLEHAETVGAADLAEVLVEEISIDGMCGVY
jgi:mycofactocin precursor